MNITDICNLALSYIGKGSISDVEANNENARACKRHYDHKRRQLLRNWSWGFAQTSKKLALLEKKFPGWEYAYFYPAKCLAVRAIYNEAGEMVKEWESGKYKIMMATEDTKVICCNVKDAWMDYTYDANQPDIFTPDFVEALARGLAADMALVLTGSQSIAQEQMQYMQYALGNAMVTSAQERKPVEHYPEHYSTARL